MIEQMQDNISYMKDFKGLTAAEEATLKQAQEAMAKFRSFPAPHATTAPRSAQ